MSTITVKDASGTTRTVGSVPSTGAATPAVDAMPIVQPTDADALRVIDAAAGTKLDGISGKLPATLGAKAPGAALATVSAQGTPTNRSGTITTGGTAQQLAGANSARLGFSVLNISTGDLWINELGTAAAAQPSLKLVSGAYYETPPGYGATGAISIFGASTGAAFVAREW